MNLKKLIAAAILSVGLSTTASAGLLISVDGPDNSTDIDMTFTYLNEPGAHPDLTTLILNATGLGLSWAGGSYTDPGFTLTSYSGFSPPSPIAILNFSDWDDNETLTLFNMDLNPGSPTVSQLIGMIITAQYANNTSQSYQLVDDTGNYDRNGLRAVAYTPPTSVPEPATLGLLGLGLVGVGLMRRRRA